MDMFFGLATAYIAISLFVGVMIKWNRKDLPTWGVALKDGVLWPKLLPQMWNT